MIDATTRKDLELSLIDNFKTVTLYGPPSLASTVTFKIDFAYSMQDILDGMVQDEERKVHVLITYPSMDLPWLKVIGDYWTPLDLLYVCDSGPTTFNSNLRVNDPTIGQFTFTVSEPVVSDLELYLTAPTGSTSWLWIELYDQNNAIIESSSMMTTEFLGGWTKTGIGFYADTSMTYKVIVREDAFGANPIGVDVGKDAGGDILYRVYSSKKGRVFGKTNKGRVRISIYARDKEIDSLPSKDVFMVKDDIVSQVTELIRKFIWWNWQQYNLLDIHQTKIDSDEYDKSVPYAWSILEAELPVYDYGTPETPTLTLKEIEIESIKRL